MKQKNIVVANDLGYGNLKMTVDDERILLIQTKMLLEIQSIIY